MYPHFCITNSTIMCASLDGFKMSHMPLNPPTITAIQYAANTKQYIQCTIYHIHKLHTYVCTEYVPIALLQTSFHAHHTVFQSIEQLLLQDTEW